MKKISLSLFIFFALFGTQEARASVIASQYLDETSYFVPSGAPPAGAQLDFTINVGSGYSQTLGSITIEMSNPPATLALYNQGGFLVNGSLTATSSNFATYGFSYALQAGDTYRFRIFNYPSTIYGTTQSTSYSALCWDTYNGGYYTCPLMPYFVMDTNSTPTPPVITDGVTITSPTAQTYYSNPITFAGTYNNGAGFDQIIFNLQNTTYFQQIAFDPYDLPPMSGTSLPWSMDRSLFLNGNYELSAMLYNSSNGSTTPYSSVVYFGLNSTSTQPLAPTGTTTPVISCDPNSGFFENSFCNLFVYLFVPTGDIFDRFTTLKDEIKDHAPFGYFTSAYNALFALTGSSTPAFTLQQVTPITTYIFAPLRTGLTWILWVFALVFLYKRLTKIQI